MSELVECPNCLTKIFWDKDNKCPCCGKSKFDKPTHTKSEITFSRDKENTQLMLKHIRKHALLKLSFGILILLSFSGFIAGAYIFANAFIFSLKLYVIVLGISLGLIVTGLIDTKDWIRVGKEYEAKYEGKDCGDRILLKTLTK